ncbi:MAG: hypothetical protein ABWZ15_01690 [Acidimicrobiia bacterium]
MTRRVLLACLVVLITLGTGVCDAARAAGDGRSVQTEAVQRVFMFSLPGVTWSELETVELPHLEGFLADAAVASLGPARVPGHLAGPGDAYLTFGAGTRAVGLTEVDGQQYDVDEPVDGETAGEVFARTVGALPADGIVSLGFPLLEDENDGLPYDAQLGAVAEELIDNDVRLAAIANADGSDVTAVEVHRDAALALIDRNGAVAGGTVATDLLMADDAAPFGVRLDPERVEGAFRDAWGQAGEQGVVLVEASDLARVRRYEAVSTDAQFARLRTEALHDADELFGRLLAEVDPERDSVLVVAPSEGRRKLTVTGLRTPGSSPGYLKSGSSQRSGVVITVDVGPTLLDQFGIDFTDEMEGRPYEIVPSNASLAARADGFIDDALGSARRGVRLAPMTMLLVGLLGVLVLATLLVTAVGESVSVRRRRALAWCALFAMATLPSALLVQAVPGGIAGFGPYVLALAGIAAALATGAWFLPRPYGPVLGMLGAMLGVVLLDAMTGSRLHFNAVFGYSPTANSRLYGISNYSYGAVLTATILLATFIVVFVRSRYAFAGAVALMGFVLVVEGLPAWGADVGGILASVPVFLLLAVLLRQRRVRPRTVVIAAIATAVAIAIFAGIDLMRPSAERAHLGRLVERVSEDGVGPLFAIVERKFVAALRESTRSFWALAIPLGIAFVIALGRIGKRPMLTLKERIPLLGAALTATYAGAVLGSLLNDSGAIVGGVVFFTLTGALAYLTLETT